MLFKFLFLLLFLSLLSACGVQTGNRVDDKYAKQTPTISEFANGGRWAEITLNVEDEDGNPISNALIVSTRWPSHITKQVGRDEIDPLSRQSLAWLMELNTPYWLDAILVRPTDSLRRVSITDGKGKESDKISSEWVQQNFESTPEVTVPYGALKEGYLPSVISISLNNIVRQKKISIVLKKNLRNKNASHSDVLYEAAKTFKQNETLAFGAVGGVRIVSENHPESQSIRFWQAKKLNTPSMLLNAQMNADQKGDSQTVCRIMYWRGKILLTLHREAGKPYALENSDYKTITNIYQEIKDKCKDNHIQSLRLVDKFEMLRRESDWFRRNNKGIPLPEHLQIANYRKEWQSEAKNLQMEAGNTLWPVFYRYASIMHFGAYPENKFQLLTWFKENYTPVYTAWDETDRVHAAYSIGARSKKSAHKFGRPANIEKIRERTLEWLERAADLGMCLAYLDLGDMYERGIIVDIDYEKALFWYRGGLTLDCSIPPFKEQELQEGVLRTLKNL